jgi:hypothetical protein
MAFDKNGRYYRAYTLLDMIEDRRAQSRADQEMMEAALFPPEVRALRWLFRFFIAEEGQCSYCRLHKNHGPEHCPICNLYRLYNEVTVTDQRQPRFHERRNSPMQIHAASTRARTGGRGENATS